jgi:hypothetical protein
VKYRSELTRPKPSYLRRSRQGHPNFDVATLEAELVPRLDHRTSIAEIVNRLFGHCNDHGSVRSGDCIKTGLDDFEGDYERDRHTCIRIIPFSAKITLISFRRGSDAMDLRIARSPIMQIHSFPVGIISRKEGPSFHFELI